MPNRSEVPATTDTHPLATVTEEQRSLLELIWTVYDRSGRWPIFDFLQLQLERDDLDASEIIQKLPYVGLQTMTYGLVFSTTMGNLPQPDAEVSLTVAGLSHIDEATDNVEAFVQVVRAMASRQRAQSIDPHRSSELWIRYADLVEMSEQRHAPVELRTVSVVQDLFDHEPATWGGRQEGADVEWRYKLPARISKYANVGSVSDYISLAIAGLPRPFGSAEAQERPRETEVLASEGAKRSDWIDPDLYEHVSLLMQVGHWQAVTQSTAVFLEDSVRRLGEQPQSVRGLSLMQAVFHPTQGSHPLGDEPAVAGGWHQLVRLTNRVR